MISDSLKGEYKLSKKIFLTIAGALAYVVLPLDLIPDFIPGIGYIDDLYVITWTIKNIGEELENYKGFINEKTRALK